MLHGQVPHNDFYTHLGAIIPLLTAAGMKLFGTTDGVAGACLLVYCFVAPVLFYIAMARLSAFWVIVLELWLGLCVLTQRPLGYSSLSIGPAMQYNRWFESFICILFLLLFFDRRKPGEGQTSDTGRRIFESFLVGTIVGLCIFCKLTYFVVALSAVLFSVISRQNNTFNFPAIAAGAIFSIMIFVGLLHIDPARLFEDYTLIAHTQSFELQLTELYSKVVGTYLVELLGKCEGIWLHLAFCAILWTCLAGSSDRKLPIKSGLTALFFIGSGWALYCTNSEIGDPQTASLAPLYLFSTFNSRVANFFRASTRIQTCLHVSMVLAAAAFPLIVSAKDIACICIALRDQSRFACKPNLPSNDSLYGIRLTGKLGPDYAQYLNSGVDLIRKNNLQTKRVNTLDFTNPFPLMLQVQPPTGGAITWHDDHTVSSKYHPSAQRAFGNVQVLLIPQLGKNLHFHGLASPVLLRLYGDFIEHEFRLVDQNETWCLWVRN